MLRDGFMPIEFGAYVANSEVPLHARVEALPWGESDPGFEAEVLRHIDVVS